MARCNYAVVVPVLMFGILSLRAEAEPGPHACASIADRDARLTCYDHTFPPTREVVDAESERANNAFGMRAIAQTAAPERVDARIASLTRDARGGRTVVLDNAQVWQLTESGTKGQLAEGDAIRLRAAALGSYMLVTPGGAVLRARRVR